MRGTAGTKGDAGCDCLFECPAFWTVRSVIACVSDRGCLPGGQRGKEKKKERKKEGRPG